jgi:hypothetical protein
MALRTKDLERALMFGSAMGLKIQAIQKSALRMIHILPDKYE